MKKIGGFLKLLRKERGLTQEQAGEIFMVAGRTISRWENGVNMPDLSLLIQIAEYYDVELEEILNGERRNEDMDKKLKNTLLKAADYSELEKKQKAKAGNVAFMVMFFTCVIGILLQIALTSDIKIVMGKKRAWFSDLVISILCSGVFSVLYGFCILRMGADKIRAIQLGTGFFLGITIIGFLILRGLAWINKKQRNRREKVDL